MIDTPRRTRDLTFLAIAIAVAVVAAGIAVAAPGGADGDEAIVFEPDLPDVDGFTAPAEDGTATVDGEEYDSVQAAVDAAEPGDTVVLEGTFEERVVVTTPGITIRSVGGPDDALIDGGEEGTVLSIHAANVTVEGIWITESGYERSSEDAGILLDGTDATVTDVRMTEVTFGIWVDGVSGATIEGTTIAGRELYPLAQRGNGIHLWEADDALVKDNHVTTARDGIYFAYAENVVAENNTMWNLRYGVHYMYSNDNRLDGNVAFDNDVGFALMISSNLTIENNVAVNNVGPSSHGILIKDIERSEIRGNHVVANGNGLYVYNAQDNLIVDNLVLANDRGLIATAGTASETVVGNSFVDNGEASYVDSRSQVVWNDSEGGNYWSDARVLDLDGDGTSEVRHQPAGTVERLVYDNPQAAVFADSPAFDTVRLAESSFPVIESPGAVDHHPLAEPNHEWRDYYDQSGVGDDLPDDQPGDERQERLP